MALLSDFGWCRWTTAVGAISPVDIADIIAGVVGTEQLVVSRDIAGLLSPSWTMAAASDIGPAACWQTTRRPCLLLLLLLRRPFVFDLWAQSFSYLYRRFLDLFSLPSLILSHFSRPRRARYSPCPPFPPSLSCSWSASLGRILLFCTYIPSAFAGAIASFLLFIYFS